MSALSLDQMADLYRRTIGCPVNKVPHHTLDLAMAEAEKQNAKERMFVAPRVVRAYRCPHCHLWHVGRSNR